MKLLAEKLSKLQQSHHAQAVVSQQTDQEEEQTNTSLPSSPRMRRDQSVRLSGSNLHSNTKLIREMYQRIVTLEQKNCQQEINLSQLSQQLARASVNEQSKHALEGRYCGGNFIWRIKNFSSLLQRMKNCEGYVVYSHGFYSEVFGYKMCLRSNLHVSLDGEEHLGLYLHLMSGENDPCLTWPFIGRVSLTLVNQREGILRENFTETMDSMPGLTAFEKPYSERNSRGFGFEEFIRVNALFTGGFVLPNIEGGDTLIVKAVVKCTGS